MITVSSCGVKLQEVLQGLVKKAERLDIHMHFCGFSQHSFIFSFRLGCNLYPGKYHCSMYKAIQVFCDVQIKINFCGDP